MEQLSFAERIRLKSNSGFDSNVKQRIPELREKAVEISQSYKASKNMPKQKFSKIPVGVVKHIKGQSDNTTKKIIVRDPRFENASGSLN